MTARDGFDRLIRTWLHEDGAPVSTGYLDEVLARTSATRQRPVWLSPRRWLPMQLAMTTRLIRVPTPVRYAALVVLLVALLVAVAILAGAGSRKVPPPFGPASNGQIGFASNGSIVLTSLDGSQRVSIPFDQPVTSGPTFSRDGTRIAFYGNDQVDGLPALFVANSDGSSPVRVTGDLALTFNLAAFPVWSPDDDRLVVPATVDGVEQLIVAHSDGTGASVLAPSVDGEGHTFPSWSPDAQWVAFASYRADRTQASLQIVHPDGTGQRVLFPAKAGTTAVQDLEWAPDTSGRLLFAAGSDTENRLLIVDVDDGTTTTVVDRPGIIEFGEAWSPDAARIASNHSEKGAIVVNADGSDLRVIPDARCAGRVVWSPDGTRFTCLNSVALGEGTYELLVIDVDGSAPPQHVPFNGIDAGQSGAVFSWQRLAK
jgi:hypothetical protein